MADIAMHPRTLVVELRAEPFDRWYELRVDKALMTEFIDVLRAGLQLRGVNLDVHVIGEAEAS